VRLIGVPQQTGQFKPFTISFPVVVRREPAPTPGLTPQLEEEVATTTEQQSLKQTMPWPLMVGAGLLLLGAAVWFLRRRTA
jgi:LPXTG-motif cell wall-anchored protein